MKTFRTDVLILNLLNITKFVIQSECSEILKLTLTERQQRQL